VQSTFALEIAAGMRNRSRKTASNLQHGKYQDLIRGSLIEGIKADQKNHDVDEVELHFVKREVREGYLMRVDRVPRQPPEFSAV
jgi:hypothetical protein